MTKLANYKMKKKIIIKINQKNLENQMKKIQILKKK